LPGLLLGCLLPLVLFFLDFLLLGLFFVHLLLFLGGTNRTRRASAATGLRGANRARLLTASAALPALLGIRRRQPGSRQKPRETKSREKFLHQLFVHQAPPFFLTVARVLLPAGETVRLMAAFSLLRPGLTETTPSECLACRGGKRVSGEDIRNVGDQRDRRLK